MMASRGQSSTVLNLRSKKRGFPAAAPCTKKSKLDHVKPSRCLSDLSSDELEAITLNLDSTSCLNLLRSCKTIYEKLNRSPGFWKHLCALENFYQYSALRHDDTEEEEQRLSWSMDLFHDVRIDPETSKWMKIFRRGIGMRKNICSGKFELWRLFLSDKDNLPVKKMNKNTSFRELRSFHRGSSKAKDPRRRVRIHKYWNDDFLVVVQFSPRQFNDLYVWKWEECRNPQFLYNYDFFEEYPQGLFPTAFFLWNNFLVLMPDTGYVKEEKVLTSMIRVHDLNSPMKLVGSYDFPQDSPFRRHVKTDICNETAHLHKLGDKAVALCRVPKLSLFVFNLPDCKLLKQVCLQDQIPRPLEINELDQRFLMKENTMIFMFHDPDFFTHLFNHGSNGLLQAQQGNQRKYGKLLFVDFSSFVKSGGPINLKVDETFDCNDDYMTTISVMSSNRLAVALSSGKVVIRQFKSTSMNSCFHVDVLVIPCPENLKEDLDSDLDDINTEGPSLCSSSNGEVILVMQHFESGRRIYAYDVSKQGRVLYTINLDDQAFKLHKLPGYISIDIDGNFFCAADQNKIVIWNARNGKYVRTIDIPAHYDFREDMSELKDKYCWKGHTDFAFAEDGILIFHSQRNFPIAADVMLFW